MVRAGRNIGYPTVVFGIVQVVIIATITESKFIKTIKTLDTSLKNQRFTIYWKSRFFKNFNNLEKPCSRTLPGHPKTPPRCSKTPPRRSKEASKDAPRRFQDGPRRSKTAPEGLQDGCKALRQASRAIPKQFLSNPEATLKQSKQSQVNP